MTQTSKLAYLSGLLDTDGFIGIDDGVIQELRFCLRTGTTTRKICRWLQKHFGGDLYRVPREDGTKVYHWKLYGERAVAELLSALVPFLRHRSNALETLHHLKAVAKQEPQVLNRRELAAYKAGIIDAEGFIESRELGEVENLEKFLLSVLPYLVEHKQQAKAILASLRLCTATTTTPDTLHG